MAPFADGTANGQKNCVLEKKHHRLLTDKRKAARSLLQLQWPAFEFSSRSEEINGKKNLQEYFEPLMKSNPVDTSFRCVHIYRREISRLTLHSPVEAFHLLLQGILLINGRLKSFILV